MTRGRRGKLPSPLVQPGGRNHFQAKAWALLWQALLRACCPLVCSKEQQWQEKLKEPLGGNSLCDTAAVLWRLLQTKGSELPRGAWPSSLTFPGSRAGFTEPRVMLHPLHPHTALFSASKSPQVKSPQQPYLPKLQVDGRKPWPSSLQSCHLLLLAKGVPQGWSGSGMHWFHIYHTQVRTCAPQAAEFRHQLLCERHKTTVLPFPCTLKELPCLVVWIQPTCAGCWRGTGWAGQHQKQEKGAINKQLWQRKAVLLTIKSVEQLPTRSSVAAKSSV